MIPFAALHYVTNPSNYFRSTIIDSERIVGAGFAGVPATSDGIFN